jgi:hypothetical protein
MYNRYLIILLIIICFIYLAINNYSLFTQSKHAICFITREYNKIFFDFANTFADNYDVYIVVDYNQPIVSTDRVKIIQIEDNECITNNYIWSTYRFNKMVTGWDKAFYYFCEKVDYEYVWFIEDDVFIADSSILVNIDTKYPNIDLLPGHKWLKHANGFIPKEYKLNMEIHQTLLCASRVSKKLLNLVKEISKKYKRLFFHEILFISLVIHNKLTYKLIPELKNILYREDWTFEKIKKNMNILYHPVKDLNFHQELRDYYR